MKGLETIARIHSTIRGGSSYTGVDGVFYAIQHAQAALLSLKEYQIFGLPFDKKIMEPAGMSWLKSSSPARARCLLLPFPPNFPFPSLTGMIGKQHPVSLKRGRLFREMSAAA